MSMREKIARAIRENVLVDATGMSPAIASAYLIGFNEAADAVLDVLMEPTRGMIEAGAAGSGEDSEATADGAWEAMIQAAKDGK